VQSSDVQEAVEMSPLCHASKHASCVRGEADDGM
jgi:hypothetical protein